MGLFLPRSFVYSLVFPVISFIFSTFPPIRLQTLAPITNVLNVIYPACTNSQAPFHIMFLIQNSPPPLFFFYS